MNNKDMVYMRSAILCAKSSMIINEIPIGAIMVHDDKIIATSTNLSICNIDPTAHAEINVLRIAAKYFNNYRLPDTTLYVTLEPCIMCIGAMIHARIKRLVFGAFDKKIGAVDNIFKKINPKKINHKIEFIGGILSDECKELLINFFKNKR